MFKNSLSTGHFVKIAWRNVIKNPLFSLLNLIGLASGLASAMMIYLWVYDEWKYDKFYKEEDRIFQVMQNFANDRDIVTSDITPGLLAASLTEDIPEIEYSSAIIPSNWFDEEGVISIQDLKIKARSQYVNKAFFNIFSVPVIAGRLPETEWNIKDIYISESLATKLYQDPRNAMEHSIQWDQDDYHGVYKIAGIFKDQPVHTTLHYDVLFNYDIMYGQRAQLKSWGNSDPYTVVLLKKGIDLKTINAKIADYIKRKDSKIKPRSIFLRKFSDGYLYGKYEHGVQAGGRIEYVKLFSLIAIFILIIAAINFMNLSTARVSGRLKEIGIKKMSGVPRYILIIQYLAESLMMAFLALIMAVVLVVLFIHPFNAITGKDLSLDLDSSVIGSGLLLTLVTGLIAGSYPAFYISGFTPIAILRGRIKNSISEFFIRRGLIIFQFVISLVLIVAVTVIYKQVHFIQSKNLGYDRNHLIYFERGMNASNSNKNQTEFEQGLNSFLDRVKAIPGVEEASNFRHTIINRQGGTTDLQWPGKPQGEPTSFTDIPCGYGLIEALRIEMKEGRSYDKKFGAESSTIVFNEAAIQAMGMTDPIGKVVKIWGQDKTIIGVTKNFHFESLYENLKPCFFDFSLSPRLSKIMVRIAPGTDQAVVKQLSSLQKEYNPGLEFEYHFLDKDYDLLYQSEQRIASLAKYFAGIAILISCLGLIGLSTFMAQRRQKEIGVRKVIGAGLADIILLLSKDFLSLVLIAISISVPLAWYLMHTWLHRFSYKIDLELSYFLIAGFSVLTLTFLIVSYQAIKSGLVNPIVVIRNE